MRVIWTPDYKWFLMLPRRYFYIAFSFILKLPVFSVLRTLFVTSFHFYMMCSSHLYILHLPKCKTRFFLWIECFIVWVFLKCWIRLPSPAKAHIAKLSCVGKAEQACCISTSSDVICYSVKWQAMLRWGLEVRAEFRVGPGEVMKLNLT